MKKYSGKPIQYPCYTTVLIALQYPQQTLLNIPSVLYGTPKTVNSPEITGGGRGACPDVMCMSEMTFSNELINKIQQNKINKTD